MINCESNCRQSGSIIPPLREISDVQFAHAAVLETFEKEVLQAAIQIHHTSFSQFKNRHAELQHKKAFRPEEAIG